MQLLVRGLWVPHQEAEGLIALIRQLDLNTMLDLMTATWPALAGALRGTTEVHRCKWGSSFQPARLSGGEGKFPPHKSTFGKKMPNIIRVNFLRAALR